MEIEEQEGKTWNVCGRSYKRTEELGGRTSKTGIQKITCEPWASFLSVVTFSYTLHDRGFLKKKKIGGGGEFFLQSYAALHGEFLLVLHTLCWFMQGAPLAHPHAGLYGEKLLYTQS